MAAASKLGTNATCKLSHATLTISWSENQQPWWPQHSHHPVVWAVWAVPSQIPIKLPICKEEGLKSE